jgi:hypothetical protein
MKGEGDIQLSQGLLSKLVSGTTGLGLAMPLRIEGDIDQPNIVLDVAKLPGKALSIPGTILESRRPARSCASCSPKPPTDASRLFPAAQRCRPGPQFGHTNSRMALDRLPVLAPSISAINWLMGTARAAAISRSASQNSDSMETLVACPAMTTDRLWMVPARSSAAAPFRLGRTGPTSRFPRLGRPHAKRLGIFQDVGGHVPVRHGEGLVFERTEGTAARRLVIGRLASSTLKYRMSPAIRPKMVPSR